ncbi:cytochrome P450 [Nocardioides sp.]|uniref:cytochrome P450 n=1 Tax=Nocardioides sp. TaxID=35761 RepID=UPI0035684F23
MNLDIYDRSQYADGAPHEVFAELRRTSPVHWQDIPGQAGYWALLSHADVTWASKQPEMLSSAEGGITVEDMDAEGLKGMRQMLLGMDPPQHRAMRKPLVPEFSAKVIAGLEPMIGDLTRSVLGEVDETSVVDVVEVAAQLPTRIVGGMLGLPPADWDHLHHLAAAAARSVNGDAEDANNNAIAELAVYAMGHAGARRGLEGEPPPDLTSLMLHGNFGGKQLDDIEFALLFVQLFIAANDTTVGMLAGGVSELLNHPNQLADLRADRGLIPSAVEEILRYANPLHYFRRTAMADLEIGGQQIRAGQKVALYYTSANRDESVFVDPQRFDIRRSPNPQISFGMGEHYCLGVHLARLEGRIFFAELLNAFSSIERDGAPRRTASNFNNGLDSLPVRVRR